MRGNVESRTYQLLGVPVEEQLGSSTTTVSNGVVWEEDIEHSHDVDSSIFSGSPDIPSLSNGVLQEKCRKYSHDAGSSTISSETTE